MEKAHLNSPLEVAGEATTGIEGDGNCIYDRLPGHFDKPRSPGGLPVVMMENIPHAKVPDTATVPGDAGDLRYHPGTQGKAGSEY